MSAHGFRAAASSMLNESGQWHADAIERQLAHVDSDPIRKLMRAPNIGMNAFA